MGDNPHTLPNVGVNPTSKLSVDEIKRLARVAGFTGDDVDIAAAVVLSESGGDPNAVNPTSHATGLYQVLPSNFAQSGLTAATAKDPAANTRAAYKIFKQIGWAKGWTTYGTTTYKNNLNVVKGKSSSPAVNSIVSGITNPVTGAAKAIAETLTRIGLDFVTVAVILVLLILGVVLLLRKPIGRVAEGVGKLTPGPGAAVAEELTQHRLATARSNAEAAAHRATRAGNLAEKTAPKASRGPLFPIGD